jgi:hypothetical protein
VCGARTLSRRAVCARTLNRRASVLFHVDTCIFSRDKTGLIMGKPEVNLTFLAGVCVLIFFRERKFSRAPERSFLFGIENEPFL